MQTLSRLNRAYPSKDTTYVLDFVNDTEEVLEAFKAYHTTAKLSATTDPNLVFNLRAKLDAAEHYDDFEVDHVVEVELKPDAKQSELVAALEPVQDRLMKRYKSAQEVLKSAKQKEDEKAAASAQDELNALILFKADMGAFLRLECLVIAQHHGLPTRLLDWTESPLTAAFFAVEQMGSNTLRKDEPIEDYFPAIYASPKPEISHVEIGAELFPDRMYGNYTGLIIPPHISPRISAQNALLTIHGYPTSIYKPKGLEKILITSNFSSVLKRMLINFGISRATLFPGLDGIAADLAWDYKWVDYDWRT